MAGVRYDWVDCVCCGGAKCCTLDSNEGVPFEPAEGFTKESLDVSNPNADGCVGRAQVDIVLSKPGNPGLACPGAGCGTTFCQNGLVGNYPGGSHAAAIELFNAWLAQFPVPDGWAFTPISIAGGGSIVPYNPSGWNCNNIQLSPWGDDFSCPSPASGANNTLFWHEHDECWTASADRTTYQNDTWAAFEAALEAWLAGAPRIEWTVGDCEYQMTFVSWSKTSLAKVACNYNLSGPTRYCMTGLRYRYLNRLTFSIKCTSDPCAMADYDWPLVLPCVCTGEYEKPGVTQKPDCSLYLDTTSRDWAEDKCLFLATYKGAIAAGQVECPPGTTDPNCKCCGEGGE